jgi:hypothetical protein
MSNENRVRAIGLTGIYKGKEIEVRIGKTGATSYVLVNGKIINCSGVWIKIIPNQTTKMYLTFDKVIE